ncbi:SRPBCC domain-containing protein [Streptomyces sp. NPDC005955]|uniref:SRPBCC family protein n=1 Tax=Streptomyces sp. NPDC005955 TaxID=3364738 RepID=UPI00368A9802
MKNDRFVHTTYIRAGAEQLWRALTDPALTRRYWQVELRSDWRTGSPMTWVLADGTVIEDPEQVVVDATPYRRLAYTWHTFTPAFAASVGLGGTVHERLVAEGRSTVSFALEPLGEVVKLTVVHEGPVPDSTVVAMVSEGWPLVLSSLKTLVETGEPLPEPS